MMAVHYRDIIQDAIKEFDDSFDEEVNQGLAWVAVKILFPVTTLKIRIKDSFFWGNIDQLFYAIAYPGFFKRASDEIFLVGHLIYNSLIFYIYISFKKIYKIPLPGLPTK